uniref:Uncharacterized protein n=1 Tax=Avena sativa TaxID=4498 RepID=A0ACD5ZYJ2_AVESA
MPTAVVLLPAMLLCAVVAAVAANGLTVKPGCQASCGGVDIPYPFGIGAGCFRPGFEIGCDSGKPSLPGTAAGSVGIPVLSLSVMPRPEARVMLPVAFQCFNSTGDSIDYSWGTVDFNPVGVYRISNASNELVVLGCNTVIYTNSGPPGRSKYSYYSGCVAYCNDSRSAQDGACAGIGCCRVDIPPGLTGNWMRLGSGSGEWSHANQEFSPCDYAFIVEKGYYVFKVDHLTKMPRTQTMPMRLDWAIRDTDINSAGSMYSCAQVASRKDYTCVSSHSVCVDSANGPGYYCNCTKGYEGNPYLHEGCKNINECERPEEFPCNGKCDDIDGSYNCVCRKGYQSNGDPKENPCTPSFSRTAKLALGLSFGLSIMIAAVLTTFIKLERTKRKELFRKNGGNILQNVKVITIYTKDELDTITKKCSELLGRGSFGYVYKGTLRDKTIVAVKASIQVTEKTKEDFAKEVEIQARMIHRNILKLLGCCLEVDVPMLVYKFAARGSLEEVLHVKKLEPLSLDLRLDIAIGSAEGLRYMHCGTTEPILHGDVKPGNILLDETFTPKISDFGLSKLPTQEYYKTNCVVGPFAFLDPVFKQTRLLTPKSDVYSFGAVLVELITRKKNDHEQERLKKFCKLYTEHGSARAMFDKDIVTSEDIFMLEEIGKLATDCLKQVSDDRPDMTEVVEQLVVLRRSRRHRITREISDPEDTSTTNTPKRT